MGRTFWVSKYHCDPRGSKTHFRCQARRQNTQTWHIKGFPSLQYVTGFHFRLWMELPRNGFVLMCFGVCQIPSNVQCGCRELNAAARALNYLSVKHLIRSGLTLLWFRFNWVIYSILKHKDDLITGIELYHLGQPGMVAHAYSPSPSI